MSRINDDLKQDSRKDPEELEREIDDTRADVRATLEALEHRLSPSVLIDEALTQVRRHGGEFAGNLGTSVKENPVPTLLTSIGLAWLMAANGQSRAGGPSAHRIREDWQRASSAIRRGRDAAGDRMSEAADELATERMALTDSAAAVRSRAGESVGALRSRAGSVSSSVRAGASRARGRAGNLLEQQPLLIGALGVAAGAVIGAMLPPTEAEDETLGPARDRAVDRASAAGRRGAEVASRRADELVQRADGRGSEMRREAREQHQSQQPETPETRHPNVEHRPATTSPDANDRVSW
jgi:ElaB/YqjD/DUF883 family membrane-anchored ribosome-binding protein